MSAESRLELLQEHVPYDQSVIWDLSREYYQHSGIQAWSYSKAKTIPHKLSTCFQSAKFFVSLVKKSLELNPPETKIQILEVGAGSGKFSRNLLYALREQALLDKVQLIISDFTKTNLEEIAAARVLKDFQQGIDYDYVHLDVTKPEEACHLDGSKFSFFNVLACSINFVFDALPVKIFKHDGKGSLSEMELMTFKLKEEAMEQLQNLNLQSNLIKDHRWVSAKDTQLKYLAEFSKLYDPEEGFLYPGLIFQSLSALGEVLPTKAFLCILDLMPDLGSNIENRCFAAANSLVAELDMPAVYKVLENQWSADYVYDSMTVVSLMSQDPEVCEVLKPMLKDFLDLDGPLKTFLRTSHELSQITDDKYELEKLEKFAELDPYSAEPWHYKAKYYFAKEQDTDWALAKKKVSEKDFWDDFKS